MKNDTTLEIDEKLLETNFEKPILEFYNNLFSECFIVLHPFYKKVFSTYYDEYEKFKLTYPLIERVSWESILKQSGIKNINRLALTITYASNDRKHQRMVNSERNEYQLFLEGKHFLEPFWDTDKIPEDLIVPFLEHLLSENYTEIKVGHWPEFSDEAVQLRKISNETKFNVAIEFAQKYFIYTTDKKYCLRLPYHDLPYSYFMTNGVKADEIALKLNYEGFIAGQQTKMYWFLES